MSITIQLKPKLMRLTQSAAMCGGFFLLLCEIRFEHRAVLIDDWRPPLLAPAAFIGLGFIGILFSISDKNNIREKLIAGEA